MMMMLMSVADGVAVVVAAVVGDDGAGQDAAVARD